MIDLYKKHKKIFLIFFVLTFLLYGNSLKNKYALDDEYITVTNTRVKGQNYVPNNTLVAQGFKGIGKIWKSRYAHDTESSFDYRPVTSSSFAIEYGIFGQNAFMNHFINLLLYAITGCVLFCVLLRLLDAYENKEIIALLATLIFLIIPIHSEVINNIKCRDEIFAFLFPLISLWYCLKAYDKPNIKNIILILLFFILGYYSKRTALIFIGIIPMAFIFFRKINLKTTLAAVGITSVAFLINVVIRNRLLSEKAIRKVYHFENPMFTEHFNLFEKLMAGIKTLGFYIKFSFIPYPFRNYYGTGVVSISTKPDIFFFIALISLIAGAWFFYKTKNKIFLFGLLLFLGGIMPFANMIKPVAGVVGERLAYNASFGFSIMLSVLAITFFKFPEGILLKNSLKKPIVYFMPVVFMYAILIWNRNPNWMNKTTLFEHDIPYLDKSAKANSMLANEYFDAFRSGQHKYTPEVIFQKAINHYGVAIRNDSSFFSAYNNAGVIYYSYLHELNNAKRFFNLAIRHRPNYSQAYENLGNCYKEENNFDAAFKYYKKAIELNPKQYSAYLVCIKMFYDTKQYQKSIAINKIASKYFPNDYTFIGQQADCFFMLGKKQKALEAYEEAYNLNPNTELAKYLERKYSELGNAEKAKFYRNK